MTDPEIEVLQELHKTKILVWNPDTETCRQILRIGEGPIPTDPDDIQEPGPVGYFDRGDYIALWNADPREIRIIEDVTYIEDPEEPEPGKENVTNLCGHVMRNIDPEELHTIGAGYETEEPKHPLNKQSVDEISAHVTIKVPRNFGEETMDITVCGLCGNTGVLRLPLRHTPYGYPIPPSTHYCLCPNGVDFAQSEKDLGFIPTSSIDEAQARILKKIDDEIAEYEESQLPRNYQAILDAFKASPSEEGQKAARDLEEKINEMKAHLRSHPNHPSQRIPIQAPEPNPASNPTEEEDGPWDAWESEAENNPDNGKSGWWAVYGIRHSAFAQASSALEAIKLCDEAGDVHSSWESPTAKFLGENPKVLS